jgi:hypothetical protein
MVGRWDKWLEMISETGGLLVHMALDITFMVSCGSPLSGYEDKAKLTSSHEDDTSPKSWVIGRQAHVDTLGASCLQGVAKGGEPRPFLLSSGHTYNSTSSFCFCMAPGT